MVAVVAFDLLGMRLAVGDSYFDSLAAMPEVVISRAYNTQAEIDADIHANREENRTRPPVYDPAMDAAKWRIPSGSSSIGVENQLRAEFPAISSGNVLYYWEARWDREFPNTLNGLQTHKTFMLQRSGLPSDDRRIEIRSRYSEERPPNVALVDVRSYSHWSPSGQPMAGQDRGFTIEGANWTRYWAFVDFNDQTFSLWVADEDTGPVQVFDAFQFTSMPGGLNGFWFEFSSSQERSGGAELNVWGRNLVVLQNVRNVDDIVAGIAIPGDPDPVVTPMPPENLRGD